MTDEKDLSTAEKKKLEYRRKFWKCAGICIVPLIFAVAGMTLFSIFMTGDFKGAFTGGKTLATIGTFISNFLLMLLMYVGFYSNTKKAGTTVRDFCMALAVAVVTFIGCVFFADYFNVYAMPLSFASLVLLVLLDKRASVLTTSTVAIMIVMSFLFNGGPQSLTIGMVIASVVCNSLGALIINFFVDKHLTRLRFLLVALGSALLAQPFVIASTLASSDYTINILWNVIWSYGANVAAAFVFMPTIAIFEGIFNIADDFRLNELSNLNNPLLKRLASEAPGTFNHSLVVGNLAEACASAIGENPHLARCAAYYHDIGKLKAPVYFSENQSTYNPHDELIPEVSVSMITSHTLFGEILAKQYRLPPEIVAVCREHHGTAPVGYFYRKALTLTEAGQLAVENYRYAGPKPQSKISAIIMIADTVEAALRSYMPDTKDEFEARINKLVDEKLELRQFDECPITMNDIAEVKQTIIEVLPSIHHSRVSYEKKKQ